MRAILLRLDGELHDVRGDLGAAYADDEAARELGRALREAGSWGLLFESSRSPGGSCVCVFLLSARTSRVTALDRGEAFFPHPSGRLRVLGATLWTDYKCMGNQELGMFEAWRTINDHRAIRRASGQVFLPTDALEEHEHSRAWLAEKLAEPHEGPTLIVTHHVPHSAARHPRYGMNTISPAFLSDCDELIDAAAAIKAVGWIFGHHHWTHTVEVCGVRLLSAQPGYPGEQTNWTGPGILEI
jgi:RES domain